LKKIDQLDAKSKGFKFYDPNLENKLNKREKMRLNAFKFSEMENKLNDTTAANNKNAVSIIPEKNSDLKLIIENHIKQVIVFILFKRFCFKTIISKFICY